MSDQPPDSDDDQAQASRNTLIAMVGVILLVALTVFLLIKLKEGTSLENCIAQGRHNCQPIDTSDMH